MRWEEAGIGRLWAETRPGLPTGTGGGLPYVHLLQLLPWDGFSLQKVTQLLRVPHTQCHGTHRPPLPHEGHSLGPGCLPGSCSPAMWLGDLQRWSCLPALCVAPDKVLVIFYNHRQQASSLFRTPRALPASMNVAPGSHGSKKKELSGSRSPVQSCSRALAQHWKRRGELRQPLLCRAPQLRWWGGWVSRGFAGSQILATEAWSEQLEPWW